MNRPDHRLLTFRNVAMGTWRPFTFPKVPWGAVFGWMTGITPAVLLMWAMTWLMWQLTKWLVIGTFLLMGVVFDHLSVHVRARWAAAHPPLELPPILGVTAQNLSRTENHDVEDRHPEVRAESAPAATGWERHDGTDPRSRVRFR